MTSPLDLTYKMHQKVKAGLPSITWGEEGAQTEVPDVTHNPRGVEHGMNIK